MLIGGSDAYLFDHEELEAEPEVELVATFFQNLHDYGELWSDFEPADRVRATHELPSVPI